MDKIKEISKLFQEKKYSELIFTIESSFREIPPEILNILAISRLLDKKDTLNLKTAINEFRDVYLTEKKSHTGLNGLINFLNSSADYYDLLGYHDTSNSANSFLNDGINYFQEAENNFGYEPRLVSVAIRVFKRLNNLDNVLKYYKQLFEKKDITMSMFCSWIFFNNYKNIWTQQDYLNYSKLIEKYLPRIPQEKLSNFSEAKNKKIKIGFLSSDINKSHSITFFLKSVLNSYDKSSYEIYLILNNDKEDIGTENFKKLVDHTYNIKNQNDIDAINLIRKLNLDIVFDLMGVTSTNRVALFSNRLAPTQISWLGYCNTMGIKNMDYLISDQNLIYPSEKELYSEKILYLPNIWNCHSGLKLERIEIEAPVIKNRFITFGSFNNYNKINDDVIEVWLNILKKIPNSKLILKSSTKKENDKFENLLEKENLDKSVIFLPTAKNFEDHMNLYKNIDVALDTFPWNGVTTSFEAIWMGIPVVTMKGYNFNSRCGESINKNIQMSELIAKNKEDYVSKVLGLTSDIKKLLNIRKQIFNNALSSPLFDTQKFSNDFFKLIKNTQIKH